jgi:hypothetical protein
MESRERAALPPPHDVEEALERARRHALAALAEASEALRALVDAASLAATGVHGGAHAALAPALAWLDALAEHARAGAGRPVAAWADAVADALDAEIERWEERSRHDPEARAVLRAFLGVRELLWEFGLRPQAADAGERSAREPTRATPAGARARRRGAPAAPREAARLERVPVEG